MFKSNRPKVIDANGRLPSGMLSGTTTSLGDYDQCLEIRDQFSDRAFVGKYCLATLGLPRQKRFDRIDWLDNSTLKHPWLSDYFVKWHANDNYFSMARSLCFPSICSAQDIRHLLLACKSLSRLANQNFPYIFIHRLSNSREISSECDLLPVSRRANSV